MKITFIGNCQTVALCYYFQLLMPENESEIVWLLFGPEFRGVLSTWSNKCKNKILDYEQSIERIKISDVIIYQEVVPEKSLFCNEVKLNELKQESCKLIKIPSIYLDYKRYDISIKDLQTKEIEKKVDIFVSSIFEKHKDKNLMLTIWHPNTLLFMELIKELCSLIGIEFFSEEQEKEFLKNENYMGLP